MAKTMKLFALVALLTGAFALTGAAARADDFFGHHDKSSSSTTSSTSSTPDAGARKHDNNRDFTRKPGSQGATFKAGNQPHRHSGKGIRQSRHLNRSTTPAP